MSGELVEGRIVPTQEEAVEQLRAAIASMAAAITACTDSGLDIVDSFERAGIQVPPMVKPMVAMALRGMR